MTFRVWCPDLERVRVQVDGVDHDMSREGDGGWWSADVAASPGTDYAFVLSDD